VTRTVLLYGDSNTHGTCPLAHLDDRRRLSRADRWPGVLAAALPDWHVIEEGLPGRTTVHDDPVEGEHRNGLSVLPAVLESHRPLDLVVLKLGTNDLKPRFSVTAQDIALSLGRMVRAVAAAGCGPDRGPPAILVICPPPIVETGCLAAIFAGGAAKSAALPPLLAAECRRQGAAFLDAGALIAVDPRDGIHYDAAAHATLGAAFAAEIRRLWP
jgi:lysophospholipase L1-like esterase